MHILHLYVLCMQERKTLPKAKASEVSSYGRLGNFLQFNNSENLKRLDWILIIQSKLLNDLLVKHMKYLYMEL